MWISAYHETSEERDFWKDIEDLGQSGAVSPLQRDSQGTLTNGRWRLWPTVVSASVFLSVVFVAAIGYTNVYDRHGSRSMFAISSRASRGDAHLVSYTSLDTVITVNTPGYDSPVSLTYLPWDVVAEPYKEQVLTLKSASLTTEKLVATPIDLTDTDNVHVSWTLCEDTEYEMNLSGATTTFTAEFGNAGGVICSCSVSIITSDATASTYTSSFAMAVKYVRREIRTLSDADRTKFINALNTLYTLPENEGQLLYGSKYHDADFYSAKHLNGAGVSDCDHWHDGAGLLVHHMGFTLMVEQSLQAIDPSISMPYWEYGMESILYESWQDRYVFEY